jgi:hypothetical protein
VIGPPGHGALTAAARAAGFGKKSTGANLAKIAWKVAQDDRFIAAVAECSRKIVRTGAPETANALLALVRNPEHKDHGRAVAMMLDRTDPSETHSHHTVDVTHMIEDLDREALEELRALRLIGTSREKLLEFASGQGRIEPRPRWCLAFRYASHPPNHDFKPLAGIDFRERPRCWFAARLPDQTRGSRRRQFDPCLPRLRWPW